jgi:hypothetical protein
MPDASYQENSKPFKVVPGRKAIEYFNVTIIAGCSPEMEHPKRFFEAIIFKTHFGKS